MKKIFFISLLVHAFNGNAQTNVSGGIFTDATWDIAGSPYIVTSNVVLFENRVLTIKPGTEIRFNGGTGLEIRGKLRALGTVDSLIVFTSNIGSPTISSWTGISFWGVTNPLGVGDQCVANFCRFEYADHALDLDNAYHGPYLINNCHFYRNNYGNYMGGLPAVVFTNCLIEENNVGFTGYYPSAEAYNCEFIKNNIGVDQYVHAYDSKFSENEIGGYRPWVMKNCELYNNDTAIVGYHANDTYFENNHIHDNITGIVMETFWTDPGVYFQKNKVCNNTYKNLIYLSPNNGNLSNNCWCSSDSIAIHSGIYDGYTNITYGLVSVFPLMNSINCETISIEENISPSFQIYPNPMEDFISINTNDVEGEIKLYNINGQCLKMEFVLGVGVKMMDVRELSSGVYLLAFQTAFGQTTKKLLKK